MNLSGRGWRMSATTRARMARPGWRRTCSVWTWCCVNPLNC